MLRLPDTPVAFARPLGAPAFRNDMYSGIIGNAPILADRVRRQ